VLRYNGKTIYAWTELQSYSYDGNPENYAFVVYQERNSSGWDPIPPVIFNGGSDND
jgi:hypothetical protein